MNAKPGRLFVIVLTVTVAAAVYAAATALGTGTGILQSGNATVATCQAAGFTFTNTVTAGLVVSVTVGGITPACQSGSLKLNVTNSAGTSIGAGSAVIPAACSGCSVAVALSPQPTATLVVANVLAVTGP